MFIPNAQFCVYIHRIGERVIYVGKGRAHRPFDSSAAACRSQKWHDLVTSAGGYDVEIVSWWPTSEWALLVEANLIRLHKPPCNVNHTGRQRAMSKAHKSALSLAAKTRKTRVVSDVTREKHRVHALEMHKKRKNA